MAVQIEALEERHAAIQRDQFRLAPVDTRMAPDHQIRSDISWGYPDGGLLTDVVSDGVMDPESEEFDSWDDDETPEERYIQLISTTLRKAPKDAPDPTRLYAVEALAPCGEITLYEAETVLAFLDGWGSNRRDYVPSGAVRISSFGSAIDESAADASVTDTASAQISYKNNLFDFASMLRSNAGSHFESNKEVSSMSEIMSFAVPSIVGERYRQLAFEGLGKHKNVLDDPTDALILPTVRVEGGVVIMRHFGKPYQGEDGITHTQVVELRAPQDITGLAGVIREEGSFEDETKDDDEDEAQTEIPLEYAPNSHTYETTKQFPVSIRTSTEIAR